MIPELGKYAGPVLASYTVSLALLGLLIVASVLRSRRVKRELEQVEGRKDG
ncbi:heme exporter protein CcmD [Salipiger bermudensis]|uniref:heme exporter protein CcmD n=1 Tax=Salipiger bermudensis TaxID=344736 RepID=UPI0035153152